MRLLLDQDIYQSAIRFLVDLGHDVLLVEQIGLASVANDRLIAVAQEQGRIFVTRDRDFGGLVFVSGVETGVIYLRISPSRMAIVHQELQTVLASYTEDDLRCAFVVVEPGRHRFRRLARADAPPEPDEDAI
jgi:predicted nuclease of predicted toxin-antitoxin system